MSEPFIGEIRLFTGNFAPRRWAFCNGAILPIRQNEALWSILGFSFGGDGKTTFALPDMRDRVAIGTGEGPGLSPRWLGTKGGDLKVNLNEHQMPRHDHDTDVTATVVHHAGTDNGVNHEPQNGNYIAVSFGDETGKRVDWYSESDDNLVQLGGVKVTGSTIVLSEGGGQPHANEQAGLGVNFIIALEGIYPSRS